MWLEARKKNNFCPGGVSLHLFVSVLWFIDLIQGLPPRLAVRFPYFDLFWFIDFGFQRKETILQASSACRLESLVSLLLRVRALGEGGPAATLGRFLIIDSTLWIFLIFWEYYSYIYIDGENISILLSEPPRSSASSMVRRELIFRRVHGDLWLSDHPEKKQLMRSILDQPRLMIYQWVRWRHDVMFAEFGWCPQISNILWLPSVDIRMLRDHFKTWAPEDSEAFAPWFFGRIWPLLNPWNRWNLWVQWWMDLQSRHKVGKKRSMT